VSPGASDSLGISTMLELLKYYSTHRPLRTIIFVALSGYWESLAGAREYIYERIQLRDLNEPLVYFDLDYTTGSRYLGLLFVGSYHRYAAIYGESNSPVARCSPIADKAFREYLRSFMLETKTPLWVGNGISGVGAWGPRAVDVMANFPPNPPLHSWLESEPFSAAGMTAVTLRTTLDARLFYGTLYDTIETLNFENLEPQILASFVIITSFANDPTDFVSKRPIIDSPGTELVGFTTFEGRVVEYNSTRNWYDPVPNAIVNVVLTTHGAASQAGGLGAGQFAGGASFTGLEAIAGYYSQNIYVMTDANGSFTVHGCVGILEAFHNVWAYNFYAFVVNQTTGAVEYALDQGIYGTQRFKNMDVWVTKSVNKVTLPVFRCATLIIYDYFEPRGFLQIAGGVLDADTLSPPDHYGGISTQLGDIGLIFTDGRPVLIKAVDPSGGTVMLLLNATSERSTGNGFSVPLGETLSIYGPKQIAHDFSVLNSERKRILNEKGISTPLLEFYEDLALRYTDMSKTAYLMRNYGKYRSSLIAEWVSSDLLYDSIMSELSNTVSTIVVIFFIAFLFAILFEELFLRPLKLQRQYGILLSYLIVFVPLSIIHPAFRLASNAAVIFLGTLVVCLVLPLVGMVIDNMASYLKQVRERAIGVHFVERGGFSRVFMSFHIGIEQMRKRKLRTGLTLLTIAIISVSMMIFTSVTFYTTVAIFPEPQQTYYNGLLLRNGQWEKFNWHFVHYMEGLYGESNVSARIWAYPDYLSGSQQDQVMFNIKGENYTLLMRVGYLALSPHDPLSDYLEGLLVKGRMFNDWDVFSVILPQEYAENLGVDVRDEVIIDGIKFRVVGIIDGYAFSQVIDCDGYNLVPPNRALQTKESRLDARDIVIFPIKFAKLLNWQPEVVTINFGDADAETVLREASSLARLTTLTVYAGANNQTYLVSKALTLLSPQTYTASLIVLVAVCCLVVTSTLVGAFYERMKEIGIYSSIGMNPRDVGMMFLAESVASGIIAGLLGYLAGAIINYILFTLQKLPPELYVNASSFQTVLSMVSVIIVSVIVAIYPYVLASRQVTPSLERVWKISTKPYGDDWLIPIPVELREKREVLAVLLYLREYLQALSVAERSSPLVASNFSLTTSTEEDQEIISLGLDVRLAPYDAGITQRAVVSGIKSKDKETYTFQLNIHRNSGDLSRWVTSNRAFADRIRKQLLMWKTLRQSEREKYLQLVSEGDL